MNNIWLVMKWEEVDALLRGQIDSPSFVEVHQCDEPPYSNDEGIVQVPVGNVLSMGWAQSAPQDTKGYAS